MKVGLTLRGFVLFVCSEQELESPCPRYCCGDRSGRSSRSLQQWSRRLGSMVQQESR